MSSISKVPRQCPLVLLAGVKHLIGINLDLVFMALWGDSL
jgi:hypothetical protein